MTLLKIILFCITSNKTHKISMSSPNYNMNMAQQNNSDRLLAAEDNECHHQARKKIVLRVSWAQQFAQETQITPVYLIPGIDTTAIWYQKPELSYALKLECITTLKALDQGGLDGEMKNICCARGLEHIINYERRKSREKQRRRVMSVVLSNWRRKSGDVRHADISRAETYQQASLLCQLEAHQRGLQDELETLSIAMDDCK